ncbi:MAG: PASTA domain-containing protein [Actinobacteria bacterium]|nr:MAG: PASTA domain-containing protein [Actinomycetota bacterium]
MIGQTPGPSTRLKAGSPVTIVVAKSVPQVAVPDVSGQTEAHAVKALSGAGLTVQLALSNVSDRAKEGVVLSQRPSGYATVRRGAATTVTVGRYLAPPPPKNKKKSKRRASTTNPPFSKNRPLPESQPGANAAPPN